MSLTLDELFPGATQTSGALTIDKSFMTAYGLTEDVANNPEALLLCLIARASEVLTESRRSLNRDTQRSSVTFAGQDAIEDVPGSGVYVNRLVWSVINYNPVTLPAFSVADFDT